jgi:hypothetical protein
MYGMVKRACRRQSLCRYKMPLEQMQANNLVCNSLPWGQHLTTGYKNNQSCQFRFSDHFSLSIGTKYLDTGIFRYPVLGYW